MIKERKKRIEKGVNLLRSYLLQTPLLMSIHLLSRHVCSDETGFQNRMTVDLVSIRNKEGNQ